MRSQLPAWNPRTSLFDYPVIVTLDPFSITLGIITLGNLAAKAAVELKRLRSGADEANNNVNAMLTDLKSLKAVLDLIEDVFEELDGRAPLTGHIGAH